MRKIIHIDMDAFYASVEQRDHKEWQGKPVVVGGPPNSRGVVCAASYEARKYGVKSAISCYKAYQLCPSAIFTPPRFEVYKQVSREIRDIFLEYTDLVEPLSLDEAYLDVTENKKNIQHASTIAREIREKVFRKTALTCSAGVAQNKFLAKMASEKNKPDGLFVVLPEEALSFLSNLKLSQFFGVGKKTYEKMQAHGWNLGKDLLQLKEEELIKLFGKMGRYYYQIVRGIDDRPVVPYREAKSIGVEITFAKDSDDSTFLMSALASVADEVARRLLKKNRSGRTVTLKIKYSDFTVRSKSITLENFIYLASDLYSQSTQLFANVWSDKASPMPKIRLIGISVSNLNSQISTNDGQLDLFSMQEKGSEINVS